MDWIFPALVGACAALVTMIACWWWFGRRLGALRRQLEEALPTVPASQLSTASSSPAEDGPATSGAQSLELLEKQLNESEPQWREVRPFLDTSPLARDLAEERSEPGRER